MQIYYYLFVVVVVVLGEKEKVPEYKGREKNMYAKGNIEHDFFFSVILGYYYP